MKNNPDVMRLAIENLDLRYQLQEYQLNEGRVNEKVILQLKAAVTTSHRLSLQVKQLIKEKHTLKTALTDSEAAPSSSRRLVTCEQCGDAVGPGNDETESEIAALKSRLRASEAANQQLREQLREKSGGGGGGGGSKGKHPARPPAHRRNSRETSRRNSREGKGTTLPPVTGPHAHQAKLKDPSSEAPKPGHRRNQSSFTAAPRGGVTPPPAIQVTPPTSAGAEKAQDSPADIRVPRPQPVRIPSDNEVVDSDALESGSATAKSVTFAEDSPMEEEGSVDLSSDFEDDFAR